MRKWVAYSAVSIVMLVFCSCLNGFATVPSFSLDSQIQETMANTDEVVTSDQTSAATQISTLPLDENEKANVDAQTTVLVKNGVQTAQMQLDDYLIGVLCAEMPALFSDEALKAQAVVARTFTQKIGSKHENEAVCTDPACCQAYVAPAEQVAAWGADGETYLEKITRAVQETDGQVLCYNGELIEATYFSCSGGRTEAAVDVWGKDVAYLQSVESPGEEGAPRYYAEVQYDEATFCDILHRENSLVSFLGDPETWIGAETRTQGGGVATITLGGVSFSGTRVRSLFGLNSTDFTLTWEDGAFLFATYGYGHRVGLSQYGAQAMAQSGADYREILAHYYPGTELCAQ